MANSDDSTVIGESILISGSLTGDEDLTVRGRVEGDVALTTTLAIERTGVVRAEVRVRNCVVAGVLVGNVTATESVEITSEGRMVGDISAPRVIIVDGAAFRGRIDMGGAGTQDERLAPAAPAKTDRALPAAGGEAAPRAARQRATGFGR